jgi:pilus assembly protein CpaE
MTDVLDPQGPVIAPVPRVTIQAFCETPEVASAIEASAGDRRMQKAHVRVQTGGAPAAAAAFSQAPTPNVVILEAERGDRGAFLTQLDKLSDVCDPGTKVLVIGHVNDVLLYRELVRRGVSEYMIAPVSVLDIVRTVSELYTAPGVDPVGRTLAVVGAKGGVGSSTIAHNLAWSFSRKLAMSTVVVDLDIAFGTAGLDFNQDPPQGIAEAIFAPDRLDANMVDRLMSKCSDKLSLLAAPAMLDRTCDLTETSLDAVYDILRGAVPCIVLDVPHTWTAWARRTLIGADDVVIVASPDLASLRNTKNLFDHLKLHRPNDRLPRIVLNQTGVPKRPEIAMADFAKALGTDLSASIAFDAQLFGTATNNGQMIDEVQPSGKAATTFLEIAGQIVGRGEAKRARSALLEPLIAKLSRRKAS